MQKKKPHLNTNEFLICTMESSVPKFPYAASGIVLFGMHAALSAGDGEGPDQRITQVLQGHI